MKFFSLSALFLIVSLPISTILAQPYHQPNAVDILLKMKRLNFLGSVLYVAAHPDDENTRVLNYLTHQRSATVAYLSMTRGDGGQNLIGPEIDESLGVIRTQELLAARRIDKGRQFFTRAVDFGYSKSADETLKIWGKDEILSDVIYVYRQFQPDIIITRFPPDRRAGHGHHTASAMLAIEAFDLSGDGQYKKDQIKKWGLWKPHQLFINTGRWWNKDINKDTPGVLTLPIGSYHALLGKSCTELAAYGRTQHKSQGFGSRPVRGHVPEFLEWVKGEPLSSGFFDHVNTTWTRLKGGKKVQPLVDRLIQTFNYEKPYKSVPLLIQIRKTIQQVEKSVWKERKLQEVNTLIQDCMGLFFKASSSRHYVAPGESLSVSFEVINRSPQEISLVSIQAPLLKFDTLCKQNLVDNRLYRFKSNKQLAKEAPYSDPYWIKNEHPMGRFSVSSEDLIGQAQNDPALIARAVFDVMGQSLLCEVPVYYERVDPIQGEVYRSVEIVPPVVLNLSPSMLVFTQKKEQKIQVQVTSNSIKKIQGTLTLKMEEGWKSVPTSYPLSLSTTDDQANFSFKIYPPQNQQSSFIRGLVNLDKGSYDQSLVSIHYDHISAQTILPAAEIQVVRVDAKKLGNTVGYISGAGDGIPLALQNLGYEVKKLNGKEIKLDDISQLDAVVLGVRALNTNEQIRHQMPILLSYVKAGGTLLLQYNTTRSLKVNSDELAPYPIKLSRHRISQEDSEVKILAADHPVLQFPNKITNEDFTGWVQERGLYYPEQWDERYTALISGHDKDSQPLDGGILVAPYGKGFYIYTSLSFFRQLPKGVMGAYRLFANLISLGNYEQDAYLHKP